MSDANPHAARLQEARVKNSVKETNNSLDADDVKKSTAPAFPLEVFPTAVQQMIVEADERMHYGIEFTACSLLFAAASAIGNSCVVQMSPDWKGG